MVDTIDSLNFLAEVRSCQSNVEDDRLMSAAEAARISGTLTPLIKEELWCVIQSRRLSQGCEELVINHQTDSPNHDIISMCDLKKRCSRMEQNRRAARKYRQKKKEEAHLIKQETTQLLTVNARLKAELAELQTEKQHLQRIILEHLRICPLGPNKSQSPLGLQQTLCPTLS
ncbi:cyclic AMP-dependent transcription factor ATF-3-like [Liolophura sinensis]|uniref:cyclic AMP-dependent transcription factor ATF-3-like n=1 Tax=Liolophura sinensis TaxID=3198878 RepID=UPI003158847E